jgi:high-affinity nickel-transport protein
MVASLLQAAADDGFRLGLLATAFGFGLRHGIDWDHLAAIADLTSAQSDRRRSMLLATLYAAGHAVVVFVLGVAAIVAGDRLPDNVDAVMGRVVGVTLVVLGLYVLWSLARHGRDFRMRSRWVLLLSGLRRLGRWASRRPVVVEHDHAHDDSHHGHGHDAAVAAASGAVVTKQAHRHAHRHIGSLPPDPFDGYGRRTAFGIGALHGIGAETPTQVVLFVTAAGVAGAAGGVAMLVAFLVGLVATNTAIAVASTFGFLHAERHWGLYVGVAVFTGAASLVVGLLFTFGRDSVLPPFFGG